MSGSHTKTIILGNLGADPEIRDLPNGGQVASLRVATSESWKDRETGERKEKTEWHSVSVFGDGLVNVCKNYLKKGSKVYLEGKNQTRSYEKEGVKHYSTEVVLQGFGAVLTMCDGRSNANGGSEENTGYSNTGAAQTNNNKFVSMPDDGLQDIPF